MFDAVIPARNEATTVGAVVQTLRGHPLISQVIVVNNGSSDDTHGAAANAGAVVVDHPIQGLGGAVKAGLAQVTSRFVLKTDADIENWNPEWVDLLLPETDETLTRIVFDSPYDTFPVTRLVAEPWLRLCLGGEPPPRSLSGTYAFNSKLFDPLGLADDWAFDISLLCSALERSINIRNEHVGLLVDRQRDIEHYVPMATEILRFFLSRYGRRLTVG